MPVAELERVWQRLRRADDPLPDALTEAAESAGDSDNTQTAIGARGANNCALLGYRLPLRDRKFADSPLEGDGFEIPVPRQINNALRHPR
jgi:hypothetical protein